MGLRKQRTVWITGQIRTSARCFSFRDARKLSAVKFEFEILWKLKSFGQDGFMRRVEVFPAQVKLQSTEQFGPVCPPGCPLGV